MGREHNYKDAKLEMTKSGSELMIRRKSVVKLLSRKT